MPSCSRGSQYHCSALTATVTPAYERIRGKTTAFIYAKLSSKRSGRAVSRKFCELKGCTHSHPAGVRSTYVILTKRRHNATHNETADAVTHRGVAFLLNALRAGQERIPISLIGSHAGACMFGATTAAYRSLPPAIRVERPHAANRHRMYRSRPCQETVRWRNRRPCFH